MTETYILGGYTKGRNPGLTRVDFDPVTGQFGTPHLIAGLNQPTFATYDATSGLLFAIHRGDDASGLVAYRRDGQDWVETSRCLNTAIPGCHLVTHGPSQTVYVANYHEGSIDSYHYTDGQLTAFERHEQVGSSVHPNQASAHIHFVGLNASQDRLYVCDLGSDRLYVYAVDQASGALTLTQTVVTPAGTGPRHLVFHPSQPYLYVTGELANNLLTYRIADDGQLHLADQSPVVDAAYQTTAAGAAIRISQDGRFLYTSTRFHNVICVFDLTDPAHPAKVQEIDSGGQIPRDFILSKDETYVLVGHQDSDHLVVFRRDADSGQLSQVNADTQAPECVCLCPID